MNSVNDKKGLNPRLDMTPMIDVVFQLLIFFVVAIKQEDILSQLSAFRPQPGTVINPGVELISLEIRSSGFSLNGRPVTISQLDHRLEQYSRLSNTATVTLKCSVDSPHGLLVQALDLCSKHGMENVSIFSRQ